jgi:hypothetical protein
LIGLVGVYLSKVPFCRQYLLAHQKVEYLIFDAPNVGTGRLAGVAI